MDELNLKLCGGLSARGFKGKPQFNRSDGGLKAPKKTSIPKIPSSGVCFGRISKAGEQALG